MVEKGWLLGHNVVPQPESPQQPPPLTMNLKEDCRNNKLTLLAMHKFIQETAAGRGLSLEGPLATICEHAGVNRTQVYERKKQLEDALARTALAGPGHPVRRSASVPAHEQEKGFRLREQVLRYRLDHPGALVLHAGGRATYSDGFIRFILDLLDEWAGSLEQYCERVDVPQQTLRCWSKRDQVQAHEAHRSRPCSSVPSRASDEARQIAEDYSTWEGKLRDFFKYEAARLHLGPTPIRRVLIILGLLSVRSAKGPRYRGTLQRCLAGSILVTDGKTVAALCTGSGEIRHYNWQGIVDQATTCHTAVVVTDTESAEGVREAFDMSCKFLGRPPQALVHDNKPIHDDRQLREHVEKTTTMIPATPKRGENKADMEGEFGKFEQAVGTIFLDDSSEEALKKTAVREVIRAYTSGINHAGRAQFDGKSREAVLRETSPDPEQDWRFIEQLHADHTKKQCVDVLPTRLVSRVLLDEGFERFGITGLDPKGKIREWLAGRYTPEALRQGLAIFGTEREKGRLRNKTAHRYLVKVIQNCQNEIDLRRQEELLREYAKVERPVWLQELEAEYEILATECIDVSLEKDLAFHLSDNAVFGGLILQRAFWENKLKTLLEKQRDRFTSVCRHVRRLYEATWENRFALLSKLVAWEYQLTQ